MLKLKQVLILSLFATSILSACSKNENPNNDNSNKDNPGNVGPKPETGAKTSIIISGGKLKVNPTHGFNDSIPAYWIDGVEKKLPNFKMEGSYGISTAIAVSKTGKLHFITGGRKDNTGISQYWIDGIEQTLPSTLTGFTDYIGAATQNEKLHLIGYKFTGTTENSNYKYWIDGIEQSLPRNVNYVTDISLSTDEVYMGISGRIDSKKGVFIIRGGANEVLGSTIANRIAIYKGDVHIVGEEYESQSSQIMKYWVGGVKHDLPNSSHIYGTSSMAIVNGKVHIIAGLYKNDSFTYKYWIDGIEQPLPKGATQLNDITVFNDDVYILGAVSDKTTYWANGVAHSLPTEMGYANKIIVIKR